jgi:hypothetical protein
MRHTTSSFSLTLGALALSLSGIAHAGPYAPAAAKPGSTAIHKDSASFVQWATGYQNYVPGPNVDTAATGAGSNWTNPAKAFGKAEGTAGDVVVLGDSGTITLTFGGYISNGAGADFAVFENSFSDTFIELAWVEVSSDGTNFFRFPNASLTANPVSAYGSIDPTNINGLAGKYKQGYGTPFDLDRLVGTVGLDLNKVQYVRIVDIVGNGTALDSAGRKIYDPFPTYGTGGFDLDAVGVINFAGFPVAIPAVPEPSVLASFGIGLAVLGLMRRRGSWRAA